jgi:hypothetical protein
VSLAGAGSGRLNGLEPMARCRTQQRKRRGCGQHRPPQRRSRRASPAERAELPRHRRGRGSRVSSWRRDSRSSPKQPPQGKKRRGLRQPDAPRRRSRRVQPAERAEPASSPRDRSREPSWHWRAAQLAPNHRAGSKAGPAASPVRRGVDPGAGARFASRPMS